MIGASTARAQSCGSSSVPPILAPSTPLHEFTAELGTMSVRQLDGLRTRATVASAQSQAFWEQGSLVGQALVVRSHVVDRGVPLSGVTAAASFLRVGGTMRVPALPAEGPDATLELDASLTSFGELGSPFNSQAALRARQHVGFGNLGMFAGAGRARASRDTNAVRATAVDAGLWWMRGGVAVSVVGQRSTSTDWRLLETSGYVLAREARAYQVQDVQARIEAQHSALSVFAGAAWRGSMGSTVGRSRVAHVGATWQVTPSWALEGSTGQHLADLLRGTPEVTQHVLMLRWQRAPWRVRGTDAGASALRPDARVARVDATHATIGDRDAAEVVVRADTLGARLLMRVAALDATTVDVAGSFNGWTVVPMTRDSTHFTLEVPLSRGPHQLAIRCDGGAWRAPRGTARVADEFGGESGLVIVPN